MLVLGLDIEVVDELDFARLGWTLRWQMTNGKRFSRINHEESAKYILNPMFNCN